jgi:hypothetical protein
MVLSISKLLFTRPRVRTPSASAIIAVASLRALVASLRTLMASIRTPVTDHYVDDLWLRRCASAGRAMSPASVAGHRQQVAVEIDMVAVIAVTASGRAMATACRVDHGDSRWVFIVGGIVVGASPASGHGGPRQRLLALVKPLSMK